MTLQSINQSVNQCIYLTLVKSKKVEKDSKCKQMKIRSGSEKIVLKEQVPSD